MSVYDQDGFDVRFDWGRGGAERAVTRGDALVVVDTLRFGTAVVAALAKGGVVIPCRDVEEQSRAIQLSGATEVTKGGPGYSLCPNSFDDLKRGTLLAIASPNGATCCHIGARGNTVIVASIVNAKAAGDHIASLLTKSAVTVLACGAHWDIPNPDGLLRFATEDYLGAGAIMSHLKSSLSPEAEICRAAYLGTRENLATIFSESASGRKLAMRGQAEDVLYAAQENIHMVVPVLRNGYLVEVNS